MNRDDYNENRILFYMNTYKGSEKSDTKILNGRFYNTYKEAWEGRVRDGTWIGVIEVLVNREYDLFDKPLNKHGMPEEKN